MADRRVPKPKRSRTHDPLPIKSPSPECAQTPSLKFEFADPGHYCLHDWERDELKALVSFFRKVESQPWPQIYGSGGKGPDGKKHGLGYTRLERARLAGFPDGISEDETIFELRVDQMRRAIGFRSDCAFNIVWLDRDHSACPE